MIGIQCGDRYLATRDRLAEVLRGIARLAADTGADAGDLPHVSSQPGDILGQPFQVVAFGEINAGKSALLNALCGHELCPVHVLPETTTVRRYRFGQPARDVAAAPHLEDCLRPLPFLRDFHLIDTPGTNSRTEGHVEAITAWLPAADLLLAVFPVSNPWSAATWDLISKIPGGALSRLAVIIQQTDQRDAADLPVILGHVADLAMKRLGEVPPVFAVSARQALEAKRQPASQRELLAASGMEALEQFISERICLSPARRSNLDAWRNQAATALRRVEDAIEDQTRGIHQQGRFIEQLEREIDEIRQTFVRRLVTHLAGVAEVFETEAVWVTRTLRKKLRAVPSLFRLFTGDRTGHEMEALFVERLQQAVDAVADKDGAEVAAACLHHWQDLQERIRAELGIEARTKEPLAETLAAARQRFATRLGGAARAGIGTLKIRNQLDKELRRRNLALKSFTATTLILTTAGAVCGALGLPWLPAILCGLAAAFLAGGMLTAWITRRTITREFQSRLLDTCGAFASALHTDYEEALRLVFRDYAAALTPIRDHLAREKLSIEPRLKRWQELFLTLKAIEQDL